MELYVILMLCCLIVAHAMSSGVTIVTKTSIPTSYLLEIVVLTPGGNPTSCLTISPSASPCTGAITVTKTISRLCSFNTAVNRGGEGDVMPEFTKTITLIPSAATTLTPNGIPITASMVPNSFRVPFSGQKCCWTTVTIPDSKAPTLAIESPSISVVPTSSSLIPSFSISNSSSSTNATAFTQFSTVTQTVTQRILSLQNVRLVRRYPDE